MKKLILVTAIAATFTSGFALAQDAPKPDATSASTAAPAAAPKPEHEVSYNLGFATDYRYRGISQTALNPAIQGGVDYTHNPTGFYAGTWLSSIKWIKDAGGDGSVEMDIYGGKKGDIGGGFGYDIGGLYYLYPSNSLPNSANTFEIYGKITYGPGYLKYSHSLTDLFGFTDSKNSGYLDGGADIDLGSGYTLNLHAGYQWVNNNSAFDYADYKVGVSKEFFGVNFNLAVIGTNADKGLYIRPDGKFTGKDALVLVATKTF